MAESICEIGKLKGWENDEKLNIHEYKKIILSCSFSMDELFDLFLKVGVNMNCDIVSEKNPIKLLQYNSCLTSMSEIKGKNLSHYNREVTLSHFLHRSWLWTMIAKICAAKRSAGANNENTALL